MKNWQKDLYMVHEREVNICEKAILNSQAKQLANSDMHINITSTYWHSLELYM